MKQEKARIGEKSRFHHKKWPQISPMIPAIKI
jgi:hypothetical protein